MTYRDAANKLSYYGRTDRSDKLLDYANEKEYITYNINSIIGSTYKNTFIKPILNKVYFGGGPKDVEGPYSDPIYPTKSESTPENVVINWREGFDIEPSGNTGNLCVIFEFAFTPTYKTISMNKGVNPELHHYFPIPMFSIMLQLSSVSWGLKEFNDQIEDVDDGLVKDQDLYGFYQLTKRSDIFLIKPNSKSWGLFSDRKSAFNFKKLVPSLIEPHMEDIMDVLSIVNAESTDLDIIKQSFNDISITTLFDNKIDYDSPKKWFNKIINLR